MRRNNAQNQELPLLKTRKSIRVNKKKLSSEDSNTKQNKSTNTTSDNISDDWSTVIENATVELYEAENRNSVFRQSGFKKKFLNDWNIMSLKTKQLFVSQTPLKNQN